MERPFKDVRPVGPFAQRSSGINFNVIYKLENTDAVIQVKEEFESNIEYRIARRGTTFVEDVAVVRTRPDRLDVSVITDTSVITSRQEDIMLDEIESELERVSKSDAEMRKYKFML